MPVNFLSVQEDIRKVAASAPAISQEIAKRQQDARSTFDNEVGNIEILREKVTNAANTPGNRGYIRSAVPTHEPLNKVGRLPDLPDTGLVIAADGSQIFPDPHSPLLFFLINTGSITFPYNLDFIPSVSQETRLYWGDELYIQGKTINEEFVSRKRDLAERLRVSELIKNNTVKSEVTLALTDGPLVWASKANTGGDDDFEKYAEALISVSKLNACVAGYVDKPRARMVVELLEIAKAEQQELADLGNHRKFNGATDAGLFKELLKQPGDRSAIFEIESPEAKEFREADSRLTLHFFYLNVGSENRQWLARVEIPLWVAEDQTLINHLHALIFWQCSITGNRRYPYILHRAHEEALVDIAQKTEIIMMLENEFRNWGLSFGEISEKRALKDLHGRRRFEIHGRKR